MEWNDDWVDELKTRNRGCVDRLGDSKSTKNDIKIISKIMYKYNRENFSPMECLDRTIEWITDWNNQVSLIPSDEEYKKFLDNINRGRFKKKFKQIFCNHLNDPLEFVTNIPLGLYPTLYGSLWKCPRCGKTFVRGYHFVPGEVSDGYHTFNELYHHRAFLFATICNQNSKLAWKSRQHSDPKDEMFENMFIVGIDTPEGQATYHYHLKYWDYFKVKELERAPKWDGHTPDEAIKRIFSLSK